LKAKPPRQGIVELKLKDGRLLKHRTRAVRGTPYNPMSSEDVESKALDLIGGILGKAKSRKLIDTVWTLEKLSSARKLRTLLQA
ncbi:MAG: hypothetical protein RIB59_12485, partial [Rhodospirillales bacterium]